MMRMTDVVKNLLIINVVLFFGTLITLGEIDRESALFLINNPDSANFSEWKMNILALFMPGSAYFRPFQLITHMFMHGGLTHLLFNMFGLFMFGPILENYLGPKKFLVFYFTSGFGAMILHFLVVWLEINYLGHSIYTENVPMLGASGAIFGIFAGFGYLFPNQQLMLIFPPIPMKAKYMVLLMAGASLFLGLGGFAQGIAHFAHLGGAIFGFLLIYYWRKNGDLLR